MSVNEIFLGVTSTFDPHFNQSVADGNYPEDLVTQIKTMGHTFLKTTTQSCVIQDPTFLEVINDP